VAGRRDEEVHRALAVPSRAAMLRLLRRRPGLGTSEIAAELRLHPNTVRFHLGVLRQAGLIRERADPTTRPGRPRRVYVVPPGQLQRGTEEYGELARALVEELAGRPDTTAVATAAGRRWALGRVRPGEQPVTAAQAAEVVDALFDDLGFDPALARRADRWELRLRHCPFAALAEQHPQVVCGVHRGLLDGAVTALGAAGVTTGLEPFVQPRLCLATLSDDQ